MSETCPTVKVKTTATDNEAGFIVINEADFDSKVHELFGDAAGGIKKPSDGLKVEEIKAELEKRKIAIPEGVTLKADLARLLDEAPMAG